MKILKPGLDSRAIVARFEQERQTMAMMDHPHVAHVYDAGMTPRGRPFFVMEHLAGDPLPVYAEARKLGVAERVALMIPVLGAVHHAHQKGVIHRDLKPSNIIVAQRMEGPAPKVIDFGIAKWLEAPAGHTLAGSPWGTPEFMSPEQRAGGVVDTRADIFSLGRILDGLLNGGGRDPGELAWVIAKATEADPAARYDSVAAMRDDLERWQRDEPMIAGSPSRWHLARKFARRHRTPLLAAAAVFVALAAGLAASLWQGRRAAEANAAMETALHGALLEEARALRHSGQAGQRVKALAAITAAARRRATPELRDEALSALALPDVRLVAELEALPGRQPVSAYDFASDLLLTGREDSPVVRRWRLRGEQPLGSLELPEHKAGIARMVLSAGGAILAVSPVGEGPLVFYGTATGRDLCRVEGADHQGTVCCFFDEGARAIVPLLEGGLVEISTADGRVLRRWPQAERFNFLTGTADHVLALSRQTGRALLLPAGTEDAPPRVLDFAPRDAAGSPPRTRPAAGAIAALAPDRPLVAWGSQDGAILVAELVEDASREIAGVTWKAHAAHIHLAGFCAGSRYLVTGSWDDTVRLWHPHGGEILRMDGVLEGIAPEGKSLLVRQGQRLQLLELLAPEEIISLSRINEGPVFNGGFSSDGEIHAFPGNFGTLLWRVSDGRALQQTGGDHEAALLLPDGRLATGGEHGVSLHSLPAPAATFAFSHDDAPVLLQREKNNLLGLDAAGRHLASFDYAPDAAYPRRIHVFDLRTHQLAQTLPWWAGGVTNLVFDPGGSWLAAAYWRGRGFDVWSLRDGASLLHAEDAVESLRLAAAPGGEWLVSSSPHELALWATSSWTCHRRLPWPATTTWPSPVAWSVDNRLAVLQGRSEIQLLDAPSLLRRARIALPLNDRIRHLAFSNDGRKLAATSPGVVFVLHLDLLKSRLHELGLEF